MEQYQRVYAGIDLDALLSNMNYMKANIREETQIMAVVKTDGYGHGAVPIATEIEKLPYIFGFAVATVEEAVILRKSGIQKPILILGFSFPYANRDIVAYDIRPTIFKMDMAEALSEEAVRQKKTVYFHIKVDTGMNRIGVMPSEDTVSMIKKIAELPNVKMEGIFTHFAKADMADREPTKMQLDKFNDYIELLKKNGISFDYQHCSNSAGIIEFEEANKDIVRAGITMYGLWPSSEVSFDKIPLKPVLSLKSHIVYIKNIEKGDAVSYGGIYVASRSCRIATIPVGYGDGYPRALSNIGYVLIHGKKAPIVGRVCMDQFMVDVTDIPEAAEYDEVTLIGRDGGSSITMEELGELSGRFNYELVCDLGKRIPRVYYKDGEVVLKTDSYSLSQEAVGLLDV